MYRTVVVPLDGSDLSERAVPFGRMLADGGRARLILMRVVPRADFLDAREPAERKKAMADATAYVTGFVVRSEGDSSVEALAYSGDPASLIVDEARARPSSLIAMSTHGRSGVGELVYGSVSGEVIRRAESPVLVIPPGCERSWSAERRGRVLVALDGSALSEAILPEALDVAQALRVAMTLLRVVAVTSFIHVEGYPDPVEVPTEGISSGEAEAYLNGLATELRREGRWVSIDTPEALDAASAILLAAQNPETALIAMATHGRGGLAELVLGSVATAVVKQATVPVLLLRPPALREVGGN
jgi:nucleotide-binding universal stress UspA family protein